MLFRTKYSKCSQLLLILLVVLLSVGVTIAKDRPKYEIKFSSLAPEGTTWMNLFHELDDEVRAETNGQVGFKMYPGGVQGDEPDVLRKMRFGQLHAGGFTGNGLGTVLPSMRILEVPFLFDSKVEVDYILDEYTDWFDAEFRKKGYVLLGWAEVGSVYIYSKEPIYDYSEMRGIKMWSWQGDPLAAALFRALDVTPIPLSVPEVLTALQTGMVDAVYTSPLGLISLQWFTRVKYMSTFPLTNSMGAVLMTKKQFDRIPEDLQNSLLEISRKRLKELTIAARLDNTASIEEMKKIGIEMVDGPSEVQMVKYRSMGLEVRKSLVGELYSAELLSNIEASLEQYRNGNVE